MELIFSFLISQYNILIMTQPLLIEYQCFLFYHSQKITFPDADIQTSALIKNNESGLNCSIKGYP